MESKRPCAEDRRNIYRIDIEPTDLHPARVSTHGWQVRVRRQGTQHTKFFSDAQHGGSQGAFEAAEVYRNSLINSLPEPIDSAIASAKARSKTGVIGLNFCMKDDGSGKKKPYVQLSWLVDGRRRSASYSVDKWGIRRAVWNAVVRLSKEKGAGDPHKMFTAAYESILADYPHLKDEDLIVRRIRAEKAREEVPA